MIDKQTYNVYIRYIGKEVVKTLDKKMAELNKLIAEKMNLLSPP